MGKRYRELLQDVDAVGAAMARHPAGGGRSRGVRPPGEPDAWPRSADHDALAGRAVAGLPEGVLPMGAVGDDDVLVPAGFTWRGQRYRVRAVLARWREDRAWTVDPSSTDWLGEGRGGDGETANLPAVGKLVQGAASDVREHWRVEALGPGGPGIYELCRRADQWRLERVWD